MAEQKRLLKVYFGSLLHSIAKTNGRTLQEVAKSAKIVPSYISKWKGGRWDFIPAQVLERVVCAASEDPEERARLIAAYLQDLIPLNFRHQVEAVSKISPGTKAPDSPQPGREAIRRKLDIVAEAYPLDPDFKRMTDSIISWGERVVLVRK